jgi:hypothetical protein
MQDFAAGPILRQNLVGAGRPWEKLVWCCSHVLGLPRCTYYYVPVWYDCEVLYTPLPCWLCHPPVVFDPNLTKSEAN